MGHLGANCAKPHLCAQAVAMSGCWGTAADGVAAVKVVASSKMAHALLYGLAARIPGRRKLLPSQWRPRATQLRRIRARREPRSSGYLRTAGAGIAWSASHGAAASTVLVPARSPENFAIYGVDLHNQRVLSDLHAWAVRTKRSVSNKNRLLMYTPVPPTVAI